MPRKTVNKPNSDQIKTNNKNVYFGEGEYEYINADGVTDSVKEMRSFFLQKVSDLVPKVSEDLENELLELYQEIPLFFYEADNRRRKNPLNRFSWYLTCRPKWKVIEDAWNNRLSDEEFKIVFNDYYAEQAEPSVWDIPIFKMPPHKNPKITRFVEKMFVWSKNNLLDETWCREHAYETLDLWSRNNNYREKRIWQYLPYDLVTSSILIPLNISSPPNLEMKNSFDPKEKLFKKLLFYPTGSLREEIEGEIKNLKKQVNELEQTVKKFLDSRDKEAQKRKLRRTPFKRNFEHFEWLVKYHFEIQSVREMAGLPPKEKKLLRGERNNDDTRKFRNAINELSETISLRLRRKAH